MRVCNKCGHAKTASEYFPSSRTCKTCLYTRNKEYRSTHKTEIRATRVRWRESNKSRMAALNWKSSLKTRYGMTVEAYDALALAQGGACAICFEPPAPGRKLCVDHDHVTGAVRGLLCDKCNVGLGAFGDDPVLLTRAAEFIRAFAETCGIDLSPQTVDIDSQTIYV